MKQLKQLLMQSRLSIGLVALLVGGWGLVAVFNASTVNPAAVGEAYASEDHDDEYGKDEAVKVTICHQGNTISIGKSALKGHFPGHAGDYLGACCVETGAPVCVSQQSMTASYWEALASDERALAAATSGETAEKHLEEAAEYDAKAAQVAAFEGMPTEPCTTSDGLSGIWVNSVCGSPSSAPPVTGSVNFRELKGN